MSILTTIYTNTAFKVVRSRTAAGLYYHHCLTVNTSLPNGYPTDSNVFRAHDAKVLQPFYQSQLLNLRITCMSLWQMFGLFLLIIISAPRDKTYKIAVRFRNAPPLQYKKETKKTFPAQTVLTSSHSAYTQHRTFCTKQRTFSTFALQYTLHFQTWSRDQPEYTLLCRKSPPLCGSTFLIPTLCKMPREITLHIASRKISLRS